MLVCFCCFVMQNKLIWNCFIFPLNLLQSQLQPLGNLQKVLNFKINF